MTTPLSLDELLGPDEAPGLRFRRRHLDEARERERRALRARSLVPFDVPDLIRGSSSPEGAARQRAERAVERQETVARDRGDILSLDELLGPEPSVLGTAARLIDYTPAGIPVRVGRRIAEDVRAEPSDVPRAVGRGLAESGYATAIGLSELLASSGGRYAGAAPAGRRAAEALRAGREEAREFYGDPETTTGKAAHITARLAGDVAQFATPGVALQAAKLAAPASLASRVGLQIATGTPVTAAMALAGPEESLTGGLAEITGSERLRRFAADPATRVGFDVAVDAILAGAAEGVAAWVRRSRAVQQAAQAVGQPGVAATMRDLENEAAQLSLARERTPEQAARLRELSERAKAVEAELGPPARTAEEVAQAAEPEPALPTDIIERERRRPEFERRQRQTPVPTERRVAPEPRPPGPLPEVLPVPEVDAPALLREHARLDEELAMQQRLRPTGWRERVDAIRNRQREIERLVPLRTPEPVGAAAAVAEPPFRPEPRQTEPPEGARGGIGAPEAPQARIAPTTPRAPKFRNLDAAALEARYAEILDRMSEKSVEAGGGIAPWVRKEEASRIYGGIRGGQGQIPVHTGTAITGKAGRAIGRLKDDARIAAELEAEFAARGISQDDVLERYLAQPSAGPRFMDISDEAFEEMLRRSSERGVAHPRLAAALGRAGGGGAVGGLVGAQVGDTPEERRRNALLLALSGAGLAAGAPVIAQGFRRGRRRGITTAIPEVTAAARRAFGPPPPVVGRGAPPAGAINPDDYVKVSKFALDPSGEQRLRDEVVAIVEATGLHPKQRVSWTETRRMAATIGLSPADLLEQEAARLNGAEMLAIRNIVSTNIDEIEGLTRQLGAEVLPGEQATRLREAIALREDQNAGLLSRFVRARSATGRNLNNLKMLARRTNDPLVWLAKAHSIAGEGAFTLDVQTTVRRLLNEGKRGELVQYLGTLREASWWQKAATVWKAGLLTNPKTHAVNVTSNMTMAGLETIKDNPAVLFDRLLALATGQETKGFTTLTTLRASADGARQGLRDARSVLRGELIDDAILRFDIPKDVHFDNAFLETYTQTVFRLLNAEDRVFRAAALRRSLAEQAQVLARGEGLRGAEARERVGQLLASPTDEMVTQAITDSEIATFRDITAVGRALGGFRHLGLAGEVLAPFRRTPSAVATRVIEYSPFGFVKGGWEAAQVWRAATRGKAMPAAQKRAAEILGRATTGTAAIATGWLLYENGLATGAMPPSGRDREQWYTEGKQPNAVLIDGQWRNVGRLSPLGNLIALGANMAAAVDADETRSWPERAGEFAASTIRTVADQPFVTGLRTATAALVNPEREGGRFVTQLAGSVVPAGVAAVARTVDPTIRRPETVGGTILSRLPGLGRGVRPVRGVFGEEVRREPGVIANLLDPTTPRRDVRQLDPLVREMARVGAGIGALTKRADETPDEFAQRQITYGQRTRARLERLLRTPGYRNADMDRQAEMIEDAVTDLRRTLSRGQRHRRSAVVR